VKGYLFGLGAMLVGVGLMFVLMHGEVSAMASEDEATKEWSTYCETVSKKYKPQLEFCKVRNLTCVLYSTGHQTGSLNRNSSISCVKN